MLACCAAYIYWGTISGFCPNTICTEDLETKRNVLISTTTTQALSHWTIMDVGDVKSQAKQTRNRQKKLPSERHASFHALKVHTDASGA